ncbi:unnamed protein product [Lepidochelys kempii]
MKRRLFRELAIAAGGQQGAAGLSHGGATRLHEPPAPAAARKQRSGRGFCSLQAACSARAEEEDRSSYDQNIKRSGPKLTQKREDNRGFAVSRFKESIGNLLPLG